MSDGDLVAAILATVLEQTGLDFSRYRHGTIVRRIHNRMLTVRLDTLERYLARLRADPDEASQLAERLAIKVSRFYRNAPTFDALADDILPALAAARHPAPLRLWSAGCGCGEEAYTLAMLLDQLGLPGVVEATDIDATALSRAAAGVYPASALAELPNHLAARYLRPVPGCARATYGVSADLRGRLRFRYHDLTSGRAAHVDAPCDLVACRNVLIYFEAPAQELALEAILSGLAEGGIVCLGEAEWPTSSLVEHFKPIDARKRLFRAVHTSAEES
jgi:chemotaxis methyl-accepting protein methylase